MDNTQQKITLIIIIAFIVLLSTSIIFGVKYFNEISEKEKLHLVNEQNKRALVAKTEKIERDSLTAYNRLAMVLDLQAKTEKDNEDLAELLEEKNETILSQSSTIVDLRLQLDVEGTIEGDTTEVPDFLIGKTIPFNDTTKYYLFQSKVTLGNPSRLKVSKFSLTPFQLDNHISRNEDGVWSGFATITPDYMNDILKITDLKVIVDQDDYLRVEEDINKFRLDLAVGGGMYVVPETYLYLGVSAIFNKTHVAEYSRGFGIVFHQFGYKYIFSIIK